MAVQRVPDVSRVPAAYLRPVDPPTSRRHRRSRLTVRNAAHAVAVLAAAGCITAWWYLMAVLWLGPHVRAVEVRWIVICIACAVVAWVASRAEEVVGRGVR